MQGQDQMRAVDSLRLMGCLIVCCAACDSASGTPPTTRDESRVEAGDASTPDAADEPSDASVTDAGVYTYDPSVCNRASEALSAFLTGEVVNTFSDCASDDDCVAVTASLECEGVLFIGSCGGVVARAQEDAYYDALLALEAGFCETTEPTELQCILSPSCLRTAPACIDGLCTTRPE